MDGVPESTIATYDYFYDEAGNPSYMQVIEGTTTYTYYYVVDAYGNVTNMFDADGKFLVTYFYDSRRNGEGESNQVAGKQHWH